MLLLLLLTSVLKLGQKHNAFDWQAEQNGGCSFDVGLPLGYCIWQLVEFPVRYADLALCMSSVHASTTVETTLGYCANYN